MRDWRGQVRGAGIRSPLAFAPPSRGRGRHGGFGSELEADRVSKGLNGIGQDIEYTSGEQDAQCVHVLSGTVHHPGCWHLRQSLSEGRTVNGNTEKSVPVAQDAIIK